VDDEVERKQTGAEFTSSQSLPQELQKRELPIEAAMGEEKNSPLTGLPQLVVNQTLNTRNRFTP